MNADTMNKENCDLSANRSRFSGRRRSARLCHAGMLLRGMGTALSIATAIGALVFPTSGCRSGNGARAAGQTNDALAAPSEIQANSGAATAAAGVGFKEVAAAAGITYSYPKLVRPIGIKETFGCGCAFLDYDNDGLLDILLVARPFSHLYRNAGGGRFEDVTEKTGLSTARGEWHGCAVGDIDGDGRPDLLLNGFHSLALLRGTEDNRFKDITRTADLDPKNGGRWGSGAGFMDLDGDGKLDLVLLRYVLFGPGDKDLCLLGPHVLTGCRPQDFRPDRPQVFRNVGKGRFTDVSAQAGMASTHGKALVLAFADLKGEGSPSIYIGNDGETGDVLEPRGGGGLRFENVGSITGLDSTDTGTAVSAMGADWGDYDRDGHLDLVVTNFSGAKYQLYRSSGQGYFEHTEGTVGIGAPTLKPLGFGAKWIDFDNDGWLDLVFANGHVYDGPERLDGYSNLAQPLMLFRSDKGKHFTDIAPVLGGDAVRPILGRGLASGDYDNDGRMDFLAVDYEGRPLLFHNESQAAAHWITLDIRGNAPNAFAYGARVTVRASGQLWEGYVSPASSYLSSSDPRVHFGLGPDVRTLDTVAIRWQNGEERILRNVAVDQILRVDPAKSGKSGGEGAPSRAESKT